jgi:uncharacterized membrane protein
MSIMGLVAGVSILIGLVFWFMGAPWILPFALIESLLLAIGFVCHAKTVSDFDEITLNEKHLLVKQERGGQVREHRFNRGLFRVSMMDGPPPRVRVGESGRYVDLGEWMLPQDRLSLCRKLEIAASSLH